MDKTDNSSQLVEPRQAACAENPTARIVSPEQLRKLLNDHRNSLRKRCFELRQAAMRMEKDIATVDALLAELTIG
jgi:hypothetical protein